MTDLTLIAFCLICYANQQLFTDISTYFFRKMYELSKRYSVVRELFFSKTTCSQNLRDVHGCPAKCCGSCYCARSVPPGQESVNLLRLIRNFKFFAKINDEAEYTQT